MKPFPPDPMGQHKRFFAALCEDFAAPEFIRTGKTPRANAVCEISRQVRHDPVRVLTEIEGGSPQ